MEHYPIFILKRLNFVQLYMLDYKEKGVEGYMSTPPLLVSPLRSKVEERQIKELFALYILVLLKFFTMSK